MNGDTLLKAAGVMNAFFAVFHLFFWKMFGWPESLSALSPINRTLVPAMNVMLTFALAFFAYVCLFHSREMSRSRLGKAVGIGIGGFWALRVVVEFVYRNPMEPESQALIAVFTLMSGLCLWPLLRTRRRSA